MTAYPLIERLFSPVSARDVANRYWRREALHIRGASDKFEFLAFDVDAFFAAAAELPEVLTSFRDGPVAQVPGRLAATVFEAGATICARGINLIVPELGEVVAQFKGGFRETGVVDMRAYLSPEGQGYSMHYDARIATTLQPVRSRILDSAIVPPASSAGTGTSNRSRPSATIRILLRSRKFITALAPTEA